MYSLSQIKSRILIAHAAFLSYAYRGWNIAVNESGKRFSTAAELTFAEKIRRRVLINQQTFSEDKS
jgi:hypothetical protein